MINAQSAIQVILLSIPICGSLVYALLMLRFSQSGKSPLEQKVLRLAMSYYSVSAVSWIAVVFFQQLPECFTAINSLVLLAIMIVHVAYYHLIFAITKTSDTEKFSAGHYLLPLLVFGMMLVWLLITPFKEQSRIVVIELFLLFGFNLTYAIIGLFRAAHYRRVIVNYSADVQRGSIRWVYHLIFAMLLMLPLFACILLLSGNARIAAMFLLALFAVLKYTILAHNILFENFVLVGQNNEDVKPVPDKEIANIKQLEMYMRHNKPYLKPKLKITDIMADLNTNRTSLSVMINRHYGMNFCCYVNHFRIKEFEKLRSNPLNTHLSDLDLVLMAGFSDWRSYRRVKLKFEK